MKLIPFIASILLAMTLCGCEPKSSQAEANPEPEWRSLFDGKTLQGWTPKINGYALGDNFANTFRVADGVIQTGYEGYDTFNNRFGHLAFDQPFSSYRFRMQYRFTGEQSTGGPAWAWRNSGIMVHGQDPQTMALGQDFPLCIEVQLLGGPEEGERSTANLCTPGTHVVMGDSVMMDHCMNSSSKTYRGDQWVNVMVEVFADSLIRHIVEGDTVMTYYKPQIGGGAVSPISPDTAPEGTLLSRGWIYLQSESHPVEFRNIEIMEL
ncbi:MAG: DUF1080 domain-containing protein [Bacteroidia bacterium]|nr:DUF1080 domain-containing protein [Bacteroidia bacterium]